MVFQHLYASTNRCRLGQATQHATGFCQHDALMGAHVHEMALCVTFGARHFPDYFRFIMLCSKYIVICMVSETRVLQTTLCVTFGARLCSVPWGHLDRLVAAPAARNAQETPNGTVGHPFGVASICLLYTSPSPRDQRGSRMPSSA